MPNGGRVPQFGKWDCSNPQFTVTFETARKEKVAGTKIMPSKDLQFARHKLLNPKEPAGQNAEEASNKCGPTPKEQHQFRKGHYDKTDLLRTNMIKKHKMNGYGRSRKRHTTRERTAEVDYAFPSMAQYVNIQRDCSGNRRGPSVPRFGAWNACDQAELARGYTVIFDEAKGKKHKYSAGISLTSSANDQPAYHTTERTKKKGKKVSIWEMICCCISVSVKV